MSDQTDAKPPVAFWVVGIAGLSWNLIGMMIYYMQVTATPEDLAQYYNEAQLAFITSTPAWATAAYATAVTAGVLGCALLLLRRAWALPVFIVSLAGIVLQDIHGFVLANGIEVWGAGAVVLPAIVLIISVGLVLYSRMASVRGWIR